MEHFALVARVNERPVKKKEFKRNKGIRDERVSDTVSTTKDTNLLSF